MVNIKNSEDSSKISNIFCLSKPLDIFSDTQKVELPIQKINYLTNSFQILNKDNSNSSMFEFLEPFESGHINRLNTTSVGKIVNKISTRSKPYTLTKSFKSQNDESILNSLSSSSSSSNSSNTSSSSNYNHTAILARLSSISSTFKSIFVRPKNSKQVELETIRKRQNKTDEETKQSQQTTFKLKLFSTNDEINLASNDKNELRSNDLDINQRLEKIVNRNVLIETYTNRLIKETSEKYLSIGSPSSSSSASTKSTVSTLSTTSNLTIDSNSSNRTNSKASETHQRAVLMTNSAQLNSSIKTPQIQPIKDTLHQTPTQISKWTCLVCLSKHKTDVKICSICGSLQQQNVLNQNSKTVALNSKLNNRVVTTDQNSIHPNFNSSTLKALNTNFIKTWTCTYCNFANDSLKIVCMNCRSSKQKQLLNKDDSNKSFLHQTIQTKRARREIINNTSRKDLFANTKLNTSNEENEYNEEDNKNNNNEESFESSNKNKKSKLNKPDHDSEKQEKKVCNCNCNSNSYQSYNISNSLNNTITTNNNNTERPNQEQQTIDQNSKLTNTPTTLTNKSAIFNTNISSLITPTKPSNFYDNLNESLTNTEKKEAKNDQLMIKLAQSSKWTCSVCLVVNDESKSKCACCLTVKSQPNKSNMIKTESNKNLLIDQIDSSKLCTKKWTCSTCLVQNEPDKNTCICCSASKQPDAKLSNETKIKFSDLVASAGSLNTVNLGSTINSNISFGIKSANQTNQPITFGSTNFTFPTSANSLIGSTINSNTSSLLSNNSTTPINSSASIDSNHNSNPLPINFCPTSSSKHNNSSSDSSFSGFGLNSTNKKETETSKISEAFSFGSLTSNKTSTTTNITTPLEPPKISFNSNPQNESNFNQPSNSLLGSSSILQNTSSNSNKTIVENSGFSFKSSSSTNSTGQFSINHNQSTNTPNKDLSNQSTTNIFGSKNNKETTNNSNFKFGSNNLSNTVNSITNNSESNKQNSEASLFKFGFTTTFNADTNANTTANYNIKSMTNNNLFFGSSNSTNLFGANTNSMKTETNSNSTTNGLFSSNINRNTNNNTSNTTSITTTNNNNYNKTDVTETSKPFVFGSSSNNTNEKSLKTFSGTTSNILVNTQSTNNKNGSNFKFGETNSTANSTSFIFGSNDKIIETKNQQTEPTKTSAFSFVNQNQTNLNFNSNINTTNVFGVDLCATPSRNQPLVFGTPSATPSTPFVFSGLSSNNQQNNVESPSLSQVLAGQTTPSTRLIKKPTRRLKK